MSVLVKKTQDELRTLVLEAVGRAVADGKLPAEPLPDFIVEVPQDRANGDYSTNVAFAGARAFRNAPRKIADIIAEYIDLDGTYFSECSVAGAGFINF